MNIILTSIRLLWMLLLAHLLFDYQLQGAEMSRAKNRWFEPKQSTPWLVALSAHGLMHGGAVLALTGSVALAIVEMISHMAIDYAKCAGKISFIQDQTLHISLKITYTLIAVLKMGWKGIVL